MWVSLVNSADGQSRGNEKKMIKLVKEMVTNKPYLPLIDYRIGNYTTFKHSMMDSVKSEAILKEKWTDYSSALTMELFLLKCGHIYLMFCLTIRRELLMRRLSALLSSGSLLYGSVS